MSHRIVERCHIRNSRYQISILKKEKWLRCFPSILVNIYCIKEEVPGSRKGCTNDAKKTKGETNEVAEAKKKPREITDRTQGSSGGTEAVIYQSYNRDRYINTFFKIEDTFIFLSHVNTKNLEAGINCLLFRPIWFIFHIYNLFKGIPN